MPDNPKGWLIRVGSRRLVDPWRSEHGSRGPRGAVARSTPAASCSPRPRTSSRRRSRRLVGPAAAVLPPGAEPPVPGRADAARGGRAEHGPDRPRLPGAGGRRWPSGSAGPRAGCGEAGARFTVPAAEQLPGPGRCRRPRCCTWSSPRATPARPERPVRRLARRDEAIRLTRQLHTSAARGRRGGRTARADAAHRRPARRAHPGRTARWCRWPSRTASRWDRDAIDEGVAAGRGGAADRPGRPVPAAGGDRGGARRGARSAQDTDWPQIEMLYGCWSDLAPSPVVTLNRAVAVAMVDGPGAGLAPARRRCCRTGSCGTTTGCPRCARTCWRWTASRRWRASAYAQAARLATSIPEQRYLNAKAGSLQVHGA